jgi:hypothetical protein
LTLTLSVLSKVTKPKLRLRCVAASTIIWTSAWQKKPIFFPQKSVPWHIR